VEGDTAGKHVSSLEGSGQVNPHGTCSTCAWHTLDTSHDEDGDTWRYWKCWRHAGAPDTRMSTTTDKQPPACMDHLKAE